VAIVTLQARADSSCGCMRHACAMCTEHHESYWICSSIWQQFVALFYEVWKQKLINIFINCLQQH